MNTFNQNSMMGQMDNLKNTSIPNINHQSTMNTFNQNPIMGQMDNLKSTFDVAPVPAPKMDKSLTELMEWYERDMKQKLNQLQAMRNIPCGQPHQMQSYPFETVSGISNNDESPLALTTLPLVPSANQNHDKRDSTVLRSADEVLTAYGGNINNMTSAALIGELEPTPLFADAAPSVNKRAPEPQEDPSMKPPANKKLRTTLAPTPLSDESNDGANFFRAYQAEQWTQRYEELCEYCKVHGNCQVPHTYTQNAALARWVKRQRYQYKLRMENKPSTMTDQRVAVLERIGFVWDSHVAAWDERRSELIDYKRTYGHCNVPSNYSANRQLAVWVKRQRRQYKFFWEGKPSSMTEERIASLQAIGFEWELRCRESKNKK
jgi:hypothetical protein